MKFQKFTFCLMALCLSVAIATVGCKQSASTCDSCANKEECQKQENGAAPCCGGGAAAKPDTPPAEEKISEEEQAAIDAAVAKVKELGGTVKTDDAGYPIAVNLEQCQTTSEDIATIAGASTLKSLAIWGAGVDDAGIDPILTMPNLVDLTLFNTEMTDEGVAKLKDMKGLKKLNLRRTTNMSDEALAAVGQLESLEVLSLLYNNITDEGLTHLSNMPYLKETRPAWLHDDHRYGHGSTCPAAKFESPQASLVDFQ